MKALRKLSIVSRYRLHYRRGRVALGRMVAVLDLFDGRYDHAAAACPTIDRHRRQARREARLARFYRGKLKTA